MSAAEAFAKTETHSAERAAKVFSLIDDLVTLEALEAQADLKAARAALAEPGPDMPLASLARELSL
jgi:hypothetical protein